MACRVSSPLLTTTRLERSFDLSTVRIFACKIGHLAVADRSAPRFVQSLVTRTPMRARLYFALALAPGCGRLEFERHALDVETDAAADSVPADALGTCNSLAPFGTPRLIGELSDPAALDGTLRLLPDELTGYMWSYTGRTDADLFYVTRPRLDAPFTMTRVTTASTTSQELDPSISSDG